MASSSAPVSPEETNSSQLVSSSSTTHYQTRSGFLDMEEFLELKNQVYVRSLVPTLSYLAMGMLLGMAGNTLVFAVYFNRFKPSVTRTYILAMSVCDLMQNVLCLSADVVEIRFHNTFRANWLCQCLRTIKSFLSIWSAYLLAAVAFDRQRAICSPETNPTSVKHAVGVVIVVALSAFATTAPYIVLTGPKTVRYEDSHVTGVECSVHDHYTDSLFLFVYNLITLLGLVMCIALMLLSYIRIARQLWLHKKNTAIIMNSAAAQDKRKAGERNLHAKTEEGKSSRGRDTQKTSVISKEVSSATKGDPIQTNTEGSPHQGGVAQDHTLHDGPADTALSRADNPDQICPAPFRNFEQDQAMDPDTKVAVTQSREEAGQLGVSATAVSGSKSSKNGGGETLDSEQVMSSSDSRSVLPKLRQMAEDARAFVSRKKPAPKKALGLAKKIPNRTTLMMFVLTVIFIINYLPYLAIVTVRSRQGPAAITDVIGVNGYQIGLRSYFINCVINPWVYSFCSVRFRQECQQLFNCKTN